MKKRKFKLLASLTSLVLVVAVMAIGVWAATQQAVNVSTSVQFTATGVSGTIKGNLTGLQGGTLYYNSEATPATEGSAIEFSPSVDLSPNTWTIAETAIGYEETDGVANGLANSLVYTFTVTNASTTTDMLLEVSDVKVGGTAIIAGGDAVSNLLFTSTSEYESENPEKDPLKLTIVASDDGTFTMTFDVDDDAQSIDSAVITFTLTLSIAS